jgi:hypothetical protein
MILYNFRPDLLQSDPTVALPPQDKQVFLHDRGLDPVGDESREPDPVQTSAGPACPETACYRAVP